MRPFFDLAGGRDPNPGERAALGFLHAIVEDYRAGALSVDDVRRETTGYERFMILRRFTPPDHPLHLAVCALFDALVRSDRNEVVGRVTSTPFGDFTLAELSGADDALARWEREVARRLAERRTA